MDSDGSYEFYVEAIREFEVFGKMFAICLGSHFERFAKLLMLVSLFFLRIWDKEKEDLSLRIKFVSKVNRWRIIKKQVLRFLEMIDCFERVSNGWRIVEIRVVI